MCVIGTSMSSYTCQARACIKLKHWGEYIKGYDKSSGDPKSTSDQANDPPITMSIGAPVVILQPPDIIKLFVGP